MKKLVVWIISVVLVLTFGSLSISCKSGETVSEETMEEQTMEEETTEEEPIGEETAGEEIGENIAIGVTVATFAAPFWKTWIDSCQATADELGWDVIITDGDLDVNTQINQIEDMSAQGVDGIIICPVDPVGLNTTITEVASDKGIPIITANNVLDPPELEGVTAFIGHNYIFQSNAVAEYVINYMEENGIDEMNYVLITGNVGYDATTKRSQGWFEKIEEQGYEDKLILLEEQPGDWVTDKAQTVAENLLTKYGDEIDLIFTHNDAMAVGAKNALEAAGYGPGDILIASIDAQSAGLENIQEGWQLVTVTNLPSREANGAVMLMKDILDGKEIEFYNWLPSTQIDKNNVEDFLPGEF